MEVNLRLERNMRIIGTNSLGRETYFDTNIDGGGDESAPSPMETMLMCIGACSFMDVVSIIRKKRKTVTDLKVNLNAVRATEHPKILTEAHMIFELISPDANLEDLERSLELSQEKFCSVSAMVRQSGCKLTWDCILTRIEN